MGTRKLRSAQARWVDSSVSRWCVSLALFIVMTLVGQAAAPGAAVAASRATSAWTWDKRADFETNASTTGDPVTSSSLTVNTVPGSLTLTDETGPLPTSLEGITAGRSHTVGLRPDGTAFALGDNEYGQCDVSAWSNVQTVAAGREHTVGLRGDGTVVAIGRNLLGQCDVSDWTQVTAIAVGGYHTVALRADGTVSAVGWNDWGQCTVAGWTDIVAIAAGGYHTVGLRSDGTVVFVGYPLSGLGAVSRWTDIIAISADGGHVLGLRSDGTVVAAGDNSAGQLNVAHWTDIAAIEAGERHSVGLRSDGTVVAAGRDSSGQLNVSWWTDVESITAGAEHTIGLRRDGSVLVAGSNDFGQINLGIWTDIVALSAGNFALGLRADGRVVAVAKASDGDGISGISSWRDITAISADVEHALGLRSDGTVVAAGSNIFGQLAVSAWTDIVGIAAGGSHSVGLKSDGTVLTAGSDAGGRMDVSDWAGIIAVDAGYDHTVGLRSDGTVVAAGYNQHGELDVSGWTDIIAITAGWDTTVGLKSDGTVVVAGLGASAQPGVSGWEDIVAVEAGWGIVGLRSDGTVRSDGPFDVSSWTDIRAVESGSGYTLGLRSDGTVISTDRTSINGAGLPQWCGPVERSRVGIIGGSGKVGLRVERSLSADAEPWHWLALSADTERLAPGESIKFAVRVSDDGVHWSAPLGRDGAEVDWTDLTGSYFGSACGDLAWYGDMRAIPAKRFIDLEVRLSSGTVMSPVLNSVTLTALSGDVTATPVAGVGRVQTAIEASKLGFEPGSSDYVLIATALDFPDALGGSALAGTLDAPILLTEPGVLADAVKAEIARLGASHVIVLGGTGAVSAPVYDALDALPGVAEIERIGGDTRHQTAEMIAERVIAENDGWDGTAFVATGESFPDALGASPLAAAKGWPVYLAHSNPANHDALVAAMEADGVSSALILGGTGVVPATLETKLGAAFGAAEVGRLAGTDRYETAVAVATYGVAQAGLGWDHLAIATGEDFPDALAGGALQGKSGSVMLLAYPGYLHDSAEAALSVNKASISEVRFLGGTGVVPQTIRAAVTQALR